MKLQDVFNQLTYGELAQVDMGGTRAGEILEHNRPRVVASIQLGLTALFKRFPLKQGTLILHPQEGIDRYVLTAVHAMSNPTEGVPKFIADTPDNPFLDDVFKVEEVYTADGKQCALNDYRNPDSILTPSYRTLILPTALQGEDVLSVRYRANHRELTEADWSDPCSVELELPPSHMAALLYFVASRILSPIGMVNEFHEGNSYLAKYEAECQRLENENYQINEVYENCRFERNGWV